MTYFKLNATKSLLENNYYSPFALFNKYVLRINLKLTCLKLETIYQSIH